MTLFWLGTHEVSWLGKVDIPLFVSYSRLIIRQSFPQALGPWCLDSKGFTELKKHGCWTISKRDYARDAQRFQREIGPMRFASIQDWMCEDLILNKTGLSISEHQMRTIRSYFDLCELAPHVPWLPILQGYEIDDYLRHADQYAKRGVDLTGQLIGLGSVCKRQREKSIVDLTRRLAPIQLHGFGCKRSAFRLGARLASADSMAWSFGARWDKIRLPGHTHKNCANCLEYALLWRRQVLDDLPPLRLFP